jgi:mono/diheme cytochrome c family protein
MLAAAPAVAAGAARLFVLSGIYDIGAGDHHTALVTGRIAAGARTYAARCVGCHLARGVGRSDLRRGLYPHPPNLSQQAPPEAHRACWVIKHGIKMSAMPAWGSTLEDRAIWDVVAFVRAMPTMTQEDYEQLTR